MSRVPILLLAAGLAAGLAGCLPETRFRLASFLFDGVPPRQAKPQAAEKPPPPAPEAQAQVAQTQAAQAPAAPPAFYVHAPYAAGQCAACHDAQQPGRLVKQGMDLCLSCHLRGELEPAHGELGDCLACHNPHKAQAEFLLDFK